MNWLYSYGLGYTLLAVSCKIYASMPSRRGSLKVSYLAFKDGSFCLFCSKTQVPMNLHWHWKGSVKLFVSYGCGCLP